MYPQVPVGTLGHFLYKYLKLVTLADATPPNFYAYVSHLGMLLKSDSEPVQERPRLLMFNKLTSDACLSKTNLD